MEDHVGFWINCCGRNVLELKLNNVLIGQHRAECQFHVSSDFIRRELMLKNSGFVAVNILGSSEVRVKGLEVRQRNFGWPFRWVDGSSLAEMVVILSRFSLF